MQKAVIRTSVGSTVASRAYGMLHTVTYNAWGNFTCFDNPTRKFLFISAGSSITPMMSMSRWLCDTTPNADIIFVHSAKTIRDIIFRQELELMASQNPYFKLAITLTGTEYNPNWVGYTGRLNERMIKAISAVIISILALMRDTRSLVISFQYS